MLDAFGPMQMLRNVNSVTLNRKTNILTIGTDDSAMLAGTTRCKITASHGPTVMTDHTLESCPPLDLLVVPGGLGVRPMVQNSHLLEWLARKARETKMVMSICTGSVLLALTGCLDHKHATSNKKAFSWVKSVTSSHPIMWESEARWVEHGKYITSSGVAAGIDAALRLICVMHGEEVAAAAAKVSGYHQNLDMQNDPFATPAQQPGDSTIAQGPSEGPERQRAASDPRSPGDEIRSAILNHDIVRRKSIGPQASDPGVADDAKAKQQQGHPVITGFANRGSVAHLAPQHNPRQLRRVASVDADVSAPLPPKLGRNRSTTMDAKPPTPSELHRNTAALVASIVKLVEVNLMRPQHDDGYVKHCNSVMLHQVTKCVRAEDSITFVLFGFPFKFPCVDHVASPLPDLAEYAALVRLGCVLDKVGELYEHGAKVVVFSTGVLWNDLFDVSEEAVMEYVFHLQQMAREVHPGIEVCSLYDFFPVGWDDDRIR
eukprot:g360.t1